jgi:prevent-host-death family protein
MSRSVNLALAKAKLSELAEVAAAGEEIVLTRRGKPLARIVPLEAKPERKPGIARHWGLIPDEALDDDDEERAWLEGEWTDEFGITRSDAPSTRKP